MALRETAYCKPVPKVVILENSVNGSFTEVHIFIFEVLLIDSPSLDDPQICDGCQVWRWLPFTPPQLCFHLAGLQGDPCDAVLL